jgi:hypothetical protein
VACGRGEPTAEDCAIEHWCKALRKFNAHREPNGQWRADCPVPGCKSRRAIEFDATAQQVRWKTFCGYHPKEVVRPYLVKLIGPCMPGGSRPAPVKHADLEALALSGLPPLALKVRMLMYSGMTAPEAFDKLGVDRTTRYRVHRQLSQFGDKGAGR